MTMAEQRLGVQRAFVRVELADEAGRRVTYYVNLEDGGISITVNDMTTPVAFLTYPRAYAAGLKQ